MYNFLDDLVNLVIEKFISKVKMRRKSEVNDLYRNNGAMLTWLQKWHWNRIWHLLLETVRETGLLTTRFQQRFLGWDLCNWLAYFWGNSSYFHKSLASCTIPFLIFVYDIVSGLGNVLFHLSRQASTFRLRFILPFHISLEKYNCCNFHPITRALIELNKMYVDLDFVNSRSVFFGEDWGSLLLAFV